MGAFGVALTLGGRALASCGSGLAYLDRSARQIFNHRLHIVLASCQGLGFIPQAMPHALPLNKPPPFSLLV